MFTRDELRNIPLFFRLDEKTLDFLSRTSADIRLLPGEYVVYEGGQIVCWPRPRIHRRSRIAQLERALGQATLEISLLKKALTSFKEIADLYWSHFAAAEFGHTMELRFAVNGV